MYKNILVGNKKYIVAILNIPDENIKYGDENNLLHRSVMKNPAKVQKIFSKAWGALRCRIVLNVHDFSDDNGTVFEFCR